MNEIETPGNPNEKIIVPNWIRPDLANETGEIVRVLQKFLSEKPTEENVRRLIRLLNEAPVVELSDKDWKVLENTDSFHDVRPDHLEDAEALTIEHDQDLPAEDRRNIQVLVEGLAQGNPMEAPIILKSKGRLHLLSGNTRLMICRALKISPKAVLAEID